MKTDDFIKKNNILRKIQHSDTLNIKQLCQIIRNWKQFKSIPSVLAKFWGSLIPYLVCVFSLISITIHGYLSYIHSCSETFQRGGSLLVLMAAVGFGIIEYINPETTYLSGRKKRTFHLNNPLVALPFIAAVGTLIWGYGDLIPFK